MNATDYDVIVIGGGQAGLATAYYLRRAGLSFVILDAGEAAGGAWVHTWDSLHLFSPAAFSSLPGWPMPAGDSDAFPTRDAVIDYLTRYEQRYGFAIERPCVVEAVEPVMDGLQVRLTTGRRLTTSAVVSATGTWSAPFVPTYPGQDQFRGIQLHSAFYQSPEPFRDKRVLVIGGGNSGAQIFAELAPVAAATWVTLQEPVFLPDDVDGRVLFERASARVRGEDGPAGFGDIVMVPPVKAARDRGILHAVRPFERFTPDGVIWPDGTASPVGAVIWCTGFRPETAHLQLLGCVESDGRIEVVDQRAVAQPRLWLAGYGNWTGAASATLIGAGRTARELAPRISDALVSEIRHAPVA
ncbi:ArsO family NAD(P)H-dependent flavin-containing monooxygenase [Ancylobacter sp. TS-1]|uniref:ArsO family NAD(P)H-dependent flavin-containing monooxygenase n=1 Tax=Ancylobacter sp. TS-1 TaxID=1850374 RepID=UPI001265B36C|nr:ArsO family NAD(P)H-dependent flavin-containing monooxygenase [Ancylobacter sp. TS-1]QFR34676.1 FAD-dependent oxidoreductase [Ancylobacter sp. TS-1]